MQQEQPVCVCGQAAEVERLKAELANLKAAVQSFLMNQHLPANHSMRQLSLSRLQILSASGCGQPSLTMQPPARAVAP